MRAALKSLAVMARSGGGHRRTWAVLGEMAELGEDAVTEHDLLGRFLVRLDVSQLVVVGLGRPQRALFQGAIQEGSWGSEAEHVATQDREVAQELRHEAAQPQVPPAQEQDAQGLGGLAEPLVEETERGRGQPVGVVDDQEPG